MQRVFSFKMVKSIPVHLTKVGAALYVKHVNPQFHPYSVEANVGHFTIITVLFGGNNKNCFWLVSVITE